MTDKPKAAVYIRVSTEEQTFENQMPEIERYCEFKGWDIVKVFSENDTAWKAGHQPQLAELLKDLRRRGRHYDYVVVFALDRLTRGGAMDILNRVYAIECCNCQVFSIKEDWINNAGPFRELFLSLLGWAAKHESDRKSQNTRAGLERALNTGLTKEGKPFLKMGRPAGRKDKKPRRKRRVIVRM
jgi:DNA invertase Pin-like site-specific DNA recombinase